MNSLHSIQSNILPFLHKHSEHHQPRDLELDSHSDLLHLCQELCLDVLEWYCCVEDAEDEDGQMVRRDVVDDTAQRRAACGREDKGVERNRTDQTGLHEGDGHRRRKPVLTVRKQHTGEQLIVAGKWTGSLRTIVSDWRDALLREFTKSKTKKELWVNYPQTEWKKY